MHETRYKSYETKNHIYQIESMIDKFSIMHSYRQMVTLSILCGVIVGLTGLFFYLLRMHTYIIGDDPAACINCHIMSPIMLRGHTLHMLVTPHVTIVTFPNDNVAAHYAFKGMDGMKHVAYFVTFNESQTIQAESASAEVIMDNCIRCHKQLNQEFVNTGRIDYMEAQRGEGKACWDCHRDVAHMKMNSLSSTPGAEYVEPMPPSPVPDWLQKVLGKKK